MAETTDLKATWYQQNCSSQQTSSLEPFTKTLPQQTTFPENTYCTSDDTVLTLSHQIWVDYHTHSPRSSAHIWTCRQLYDSSVPWHHELCSAIIPGQPAAPSESWVLWCCNPTNRGVNTFWPFLSIWFGVNFALCLGTCGSFLLLLFSDRCCSRTGRP